jgi:hypothetical protein
MEKNGNTFAPGDPVRINRPGEKVSSVVGEVVKIDPESQLALVKQGADSQWVDFSLLEKVR